MPTGARRRNPRTVFLNVPFDAEYEPLFCALVATIVADGGVPRCVLELPASAKAGDRLLRLSQVIASSRCSFHDLSRVETSGGLPRFNMPFELGLALGCAHWRRSHHIFLLESKAHRLQRSLSDLNGVDAHVHGGSIAGMVAAVLDCLGGRLDPAREDALTRFARAVVKAVRSQGQSLPSRSIFSRRGFQYLVALSTELAAQRGLLRGR